MLKTDENVASQKQKIIDLLEKEVMPILCDERTQIDIIARQLKRSSSSVLGRLQLIAKEEMWAYQYLVDSYLPVRYYKD